MFKSGQIYVWKSSFGLNGLDLYNSFHKDFQQAYPYKIQLTGSWDEYRAKVKNRKYKHSGLWFFRSITPKDYKAPNATIDESALTDMYELVFTGRD